MDYTQQHQYQPHPQQPQPQPPQQQHQQTSSSVTQPPVITTPAWVLAIRISQFLLAVIILGLSGAIIHWVYMDELGLSLAISLFTWVIVLYTLLSEKLPALRQIYSLWAVLVLDLFLAILWLSTMGAAAARRATFTVPVTASCASDGSAVNSGRCSVVAKRYIVMGHGALAMLSAVAGLSALELFLFVATFAWTLVQYLKWRKGEAAGAAAASSQGGIQMEAKQAAYPQTTTFQEGEYHPKSYTPVPQQQQQHQQPYQQQQHQEMPTYQHGYGQQQYPQQAHEPSPVSATDSRSPQGHQYPPQELR
ncbi:hypothetical protein C8034_v008091 [Colletotrichum sidae]|uniref:MARVEL domain-containing protein n=1 Tax=Colletotrichum sidae TaxID=1347389 RepID=A0A4R8TQR9_9PEZI|nr:hypothetical protein C8034_v008091 [Colletotrichum sidae]